jgi:DNA-directed RNA polymerase subunit RPC12/RpoP
VGSVWGRKEIIAKAGHNKHRQPMFMYRCTECGRVYGPQTGTEIARHPRARCCGYRGEEKSNYRGFKEVSGSYIAQVRWSAQKRGIEFSVTAKYLWELWCAQGGRCAYTGRSLTHKVDRSRKDYGSRVCDASLDRIDSAKGYVNGNVQWLHKTINKMKWELSEDEFVAICAEVTDHMNMKGENDGGSYCEQEVAS